jgi:hypothetical protein
MKMDIVITNLQLKMKDRPQKKEYMLIESRRVIVNKKVGNIMGRFLKKPNISLQTESIITVVKDVNFWFGQEKNMNDLTAKD